MKQRRITLQIVVDVDEETSESNVQDSINEALDEGAGKEVDWGSWVVGGATVVSVEEFDADIL